METTITLDSIKQGDKQVFSEIYHSLADDCNRYVSNRGGSLQLAEEVLHESLYRFFIKVKQNPDFQLQTTIEKVVFGYIKNVWLEMVRSQKKERLHLRIDNKYSLPMAEIEQSNNELDFFTEESTINNLIQLMNTLGKDCKEVLIAFYVYKTPLVEIAQELNLNKDYVKLKRFRCLEALRKKYFQ